MERVSGRGHRTVPHTADLRIEAWADSREECVAEAVLAVLDSFTTLTDLGVTRTVGLRTTGSTDADLLVEVLDEVVYLLDVTGEVPVAVEVTGGPEGLGVRFGMAALTPDRVVGATPKAVTLNALEFGRTDHHWRCAVTLDV